MQNRRLVCNINFHEFHSSDFSDFMPENQLLEDFGNYKRRQCFNVTIVNDSISENDEEFIITLENPSNESHIQIHSGMVTITILDNDGKNIV